MLPAMSLLFMSLVATSYGCKKFRIVVDCVRYVNAFHLSGKIVLNLECLVFFFSFEVARVFVFISSGVG